MSVRGAWAERACANLPGNFHGGECAGVGGVPVITAAAVGLPAVRSSTLPVQAHAPAAHPLCQNHHYDLPEGAMPTLLTTTVASLLFILSCHPFLPQSISGLLLGESRPGVVL